MPSTDLFSSHVHAALLLQFAGVCGFRSFWVSCPSNRGLEMREMVQPSTGPADPGGVAAASHQWANPSTTTTACLLLWGFSWGNSHPRPIGPQQSYSPSSRPEGPSLESGKSSTGGHLPEVGPWWWIQGHPSGRFVHVWQGQAEEAV